MLRQHGVMRGSMAPSGFTIWLCWKSFLGRAAPALGALSCVGHNAMISFWFVRKRATAIDDITVGQGLGADKARIREI